MTWAFINTACLSYTVESLPQQDLGIHQWRMLFGLHDLGIHRYSMPFGCHWVVLTIVQPTLSHFPAYRDGIPLHDLGIHHYMTEWCCPLSNLHAVECMPSNRFCMPSNVCGRSDSTTGLGLMHAFRITWLGHSSILHAFRISLIGVDRCPTYTFSLYVAVASILYAVESIPQQELGIHQYRMPFGCHWLVLVLTIVHPSPCAPRFSNRFCMPSNVCRRSDSTTGLGHSSMMHAFRITWLGHSPIPHAFRMSLIGVDHCPSVPMYNSLAYFGLLYIATIRRHTQVYRSDNHDVDRLEVKQ